VVARQVKRGGGGVCARYAAAAASICGKSKSAAERDKKNAGDKCFKAGAPPKPIGYSFLIRKD
jgi:hypothetical protein